MRLDSYLQRYTTSRLTGLAAQEKLNLIQALQKFLNYMGDVDVEDLTKSDLVQFGAWLKANYSQLTAKQTFSIANRALTAFRALRASDVECLICGASSPELKGLLVLIAFRGLRLREALSVRRHDGRLLYRRGQAELPLLWPPEHAAVFKDLASSASSDWLLPDLRRWRKSAIREEIEVCAACGLRGKDYGFGALRRFYVRYALQEGA